MVIPSVYNSKQIVVSKPSDNTSPFMNNQNITSVTFEDGVVFDSTNYSYMFKGCSSLSSVTGCFDDATNMDYMFDGCASLTKGITVPMSVKSMNYTYNGCNSLQGKLEINSACNN